MKKLLFIDCTLREQSRTKQLANTFLDNIKGYEIDHLKLDEEDLKPLIKDFYWDRQKLLDEENLNHPRFKYAYQFKDADLIVIAAPFWDLSFPSLLKIYIENISVDGITFTSSEKGLEGLCKASSLVYITTRGGIYKDSPLEQAIPYIKSLCEFFGINSFYSLSAEGLDINGLDCEAILKSSKEKAIILAKKISI